MRFGTDVLIEIMSILQRGLLKGEDVSKLLRELEVEVEAVPFEPPIIVLKKK